MSTPIKERGIRWEEFYGEKSSYLKEEMEKQVGPGSYFRWEGHDNTTGNDYYVVVSPGFSKKKGYFFFAGLRKMPADQGASGKKFKTQQEAIGYAMDMWNVPRPSKKPAKPYNVQDIAGVSIVLEPQHKNASSSNKIIVSEFLSKEAMSMAASAHITSNFVPRFGAKTYPEMLSWAHKASPVMGFLAAFNTRKRLLGTDVINVPTNHKVHNKFTGKEESSPLAPIYSTCQSPSDEEFSNRTSGGVEDNHLIKIQRDPNTKEVISYTPSKPMSEKDSEGYTLYRWDNVRLFPRVTLPSSVFYSPAAKKVWEELSQVAQTSERRRPSEYKNLTKDKVYSEQSGVPSVDLPKEVYDTGEGHSRPQISATFSVDPKVYDQFEEKIMALASSLHADKKAKIDFSSQNQKNLVDLLKYHKKKNIPFDWNTPCYEQIKVANSQLIVYDQLGLPLGMKMGSDSANMRLTQDSKEIPDEKVPDAKRRASREEAAYVFKDPVDIVSKYISPVSIAIGHKTHKVEQLEETISNLELLLKKPENAGKSDSINKQIQTYQASLATARTESKNLIDTVSNLRATGDHAGLLQLSVNLSKLPEVSGWSSVVDADGKKRLDFKTKFKSDKSRLMELKQSIKDKYINGEDASNEQEEFESIYHRIYPLLVGFRTFASHGMISVNPSEVSDSRTCAPELVQAVTDTYNVDPSGIPLDDKNKMADGQNGRGYGLQKKSKKYAPVAVARAKMEGDVHAARFFDPHAVWTDENNVQRVGRYVYDKLPEGVKPAQDVTGLPVVVESPIMYVPDGQGGLRKITKGIWKKRDANGFGKFIPSGVYDVTIAPPEESSKKSGKRIHEGGLVNDSFVAIQEEHFVSENNFVHSRSKPYSLRQKPPEPLFSSDPSSSSVNVKKFYTIQTEDGEQDVSRDFYKEPGKPYVHARNTASLMAIIQRQLGLSDNDIGTFTPLTGNGIKLIYEMSSEGIKYYQAVSAFQKKDVNNPLYKEGEKILQASGGKVDQNKFEYGRLCQESATGDKIHPEIMKKYTESLDNPNSALGSTNAEVYVILQQSPNFQQMEAKDEHGNLFMFGSQQAAEHAISFMPYFSSKTKAEGIQFSVTQRNLRDMHEHVFGHTPESGIVSFNSEHLTSNIQSYKSGATSTEVAKQKVDQFTESYAPTGNLLKDDAKLESDAKKVFDSFVSSGQDMEGIRAKINSLLSGKLIPPYYRKLYEKVLTMIPIPEAMPELKPQPIEVPTEVPFNEVDKTPIVKQPENLSIPAIRPMIPPAVIKSPGLTNTSPGTEGLARRILREWIVRKVPSQEWVNNSEKYKTNQELYNKLQELIKQYGSTPVSKPSARAGSICKLVILAEKLESQGRYEELESIDRLIFRMHKSCQIS